MYIPKADGRQRPLGIAAIEDKIVQAAVVMILTPIYEAEFLGFSYGFRPGRSQHDALDALAFGIKGRSIRWVLDADIRSFFDTINHTWLVRFLDHRIGDRRIIRLIQKWLKAGVLDKGRHVETEEGTPQNGSAKPQRINRSPAPSRPLAPSATLTAPPNQPASLADAAAQLAPADHRHKDAAENVKRPELWCEDTAY